jgi:hypothetical protein
MRMWIWNGKSVDDPALCELLVNVCNDHSRPPVSQAL